MRRTACGGLPDGQSPGIASCIDFVKIHGSKEVYDICFGLCRGHLTDDNIPAILNGYEEAEFRTFRVKERRGSFLLGRYAAKLAVAGLSGEGDLRRIEIRNGVFRQPIVRAAQCGLQVSLAHSGETGAAVAFPDSLIMGIDIERMDPAFEPELQAHFTDGEIALSRTAPSGGPACTAMLWTMKEALGKALKTGLTLSLPLLEVGRLLFHADGTCEGEFVHFPQYKAMSVAAGEYVLSVAYPKNTRMNLNPEPLRRLLPGFGAP